MSPKYLGRDTDDIGKERRKRALARVEAEIKQRKLMREDVDGLIKANR